MSVVRKLPRKARTKLNVLGFALMLRELLEGATSATEIVAITGYGRHTVVGYLRVLHEQKCIRIAGYEPDKFGRQRSPTYVLADGKPDVARRAPLSNQVTNARWRERQKVRELTERLAA